MDDIGQAHENNQTSANFENRTVGLRRSDLLDHIGCSASLRFPDPSPTPVIRARLPSYQTASAVMEDDDDAFLYGDEPAAPPATSKTEDAANGIEAASAGPAESENFEQTANADDDKHRDGDGDDGEEDDEDDEDSDSDIEFIIDTTQEPQQTPARPGFQRPGAPGARPLPSQSTPQRPQSTLTSEYTPLSRSQLLANASPASTSVAPVGGAVDLAAAVTAAAAGLPPPGAPPIKPQSALDGTGPEGGPPSVPSTAPRLDLSPGPEERAFPKPEDIVEEEEAASRDIFDINLESLPEKPWRRYGADLSDYFNYGFNEDSWALWRSKKEHMTDARKNAENNMFGGNNGDGMPNMQQMMAMMPPPQAMQAMMAQNGGMPPMPPDQMMAMMASMSGMPGMPPMPGMGSIPPMGGPGGMNPMMVPGMFGGQQSNGGPGASSNEQHHQHQHHQQQQRFSNSPFPQGPGQNRQEGHNSPFPPAQDREDKPNDQHHDEHGPASGWDVPQAAIKQEESSAGLAPPSGAPPMKAMSEADMSAFLGASGIDPSQAAAAGYQIPANLNQKPSPTAPRSKPDPPKSAPLGPAATKGTSIRGRAAAAAAGTSTSSRPGRAVSPTLPPNVPSGPKNMSKRYNDRDTGTGAADSLDYGATSGGGNAGGADDFAHDWDARDRSPDRGSRRSGGRSRREDTHDHRDSASANGNDDHAISQGIKSSSRSSKRHTEERDDETASQSSAGARRKKSSSRDHRKDRESSHRSDRERDREREKEREREARSQARSERRAGRDVEDVAIPTGPSAGVGKGSRKRSAPDEREDDDTGAAKSRGKGGSRKKR